jgi:hypothetical protein
MEVQTAAVADSAGETIAMCVAWCFWNHWL